MSMNLVYPSASPLSTATRERRRSLTEGQGFDRGARGLARARHVVPLRRQSLCGRRHGGFAFAQALVKVVQGQRDHVPLRDQKKEPESEERERPGIPGVPNQIL